MRRREFITLISSAARWPLAAGAQQAAIPTIGFLSSRSPGESAGVVAAFRQGLSESGFVEGQNVVIAFRGRGHFFGEATARLFAGVLTTFFPLPT
jgi:putative tryptophan/tyrosine transport system substrate-binding protein